MSEPQPAPDTSTTPSSTTPSSAPARQARPVWLLPVIMTIATGVVGMFLVAGQGLYWMIAVIALVDALGVFTIIRSARINARHQEARALSSQNQAIQHPEIHNPDVQHRP
jgi:predicted lipid-binding transport protein (Tim44 family)